MDVPESKWITQAIENIDKFLHRGGQYKGDEPQLLGDAELLNTIGFAMGLELGDPKDWTNRQKQLAEEGKLCLFFGTAREAIDVIHNQIVTCCDGDTSNFITVLPIELYYNGKLYELPLFRAQRTKKGPQFYIDNIGRSYTSKEDWFENCKLPPCKMAYPAELKLQKKTDCDYSKVYVNDTPPARIGSKVAQSVDGVAAVVGLGSAVGSLFLTGGLATPFVVAGAVSAAWGSTRAGYQLVDRGSHGESINPFTNSESRMLWLGVAANLISFGAMGASMRLASVASTGREISDAFKIVVNVTNGTNTAVSTIAIVNSTFYMWERRKELEPKDVLFQLASIAFWAKGTYQYKTAGSIIRDARNAALNQISKNIPPESQSAFKGIRNELQNDQQLLQTFVEAGQLGWDPSDVCKILLDARKSGLLATDANGKISMAGSDTSLLPVLFKDIDGVKSGYTTSHINDVLKNLSPEQANSFKELRNHLNDDTKLVIGISELQKQFNGNADQVIKNLISLWDQRAGSLPGLPKPQIQVSGSGNSIVVGHAPPITPDQLGQMSPHMLQFYGNDLSSIPTTSSWRSEARPTMPILFGLQQMGLFRDCPVTRMCSSGICVIEINNHLCISIHTLESYGPIIAQKVFTLIGQLEPTVCSKTLSPKTKDFLNKDLRLRLQFQREESHAWITEVISISNIENKEKLLQVINKPLQSYELDRLYAFKTSFCTCPHLHNLLKFSAHMEPNSVSELVAYCEFAYQRVLDHRVSLETRFIEVKASLPRGQNKTQWMDNQTTEDLFRQKDSMKRLSDDFSRQAALVTSNDMVGVVSVGEGLSDDNLLEAIRSKRIKFASTTSAVYHLVKHSTKPLSAYVSKTNDIIRCGTNSQVKITITQEGDGRHISFKNSFGTCVLLEKSGRIFICTSSPVNSRSQG